MHPRRLFLYLYVGLFSMLAVWSCRRERFEAQDPNAAESGFSVEQARAFFETQMGDMAATAATTATKGGRGQDGQGEQSGQGEQGGHGGQGEYSWFRGYDEEHPRGFSPGEFTPHWDKAHRGRGSRYVEGVGVPIDPKFHFSALFERQRDGGSEKVQVPVSQQLVVNRWQNHPEWEGEYGYIATLVPTPEYYAGHKNYAQKFRHMGDRAGFSGVVLYHSLSSGRFVNASRYRDGEFTRMVYDRFGVGVDQQAAIEQLMDEPVSFQGGTWQAFIMDLETIEGDSVIVKFCKKCGTQDCSKAKVCCSSCSSYACECPGNPLGPPPPNDPDPDPKPDPDDPEPTGDGNEGGSGDTGNTGNTGTPGTAIENVELSDALTVVQQTITKDALSKMSKTQIMKLLVSLFKKNQNHDVTLIVVADPDLEGALFDRSKKMMYFGENMFSHIDFHIYLTHEYYHAYESYTIDYNGYIKDLHDGVGEFTAYLFESFYARQFNTSYIPNAIPTDDRKKFTAALDELYGKRGYISYDDIRAFYEQTKDIFYRIVNDPTKPLGPMPGWWDPKGPALFIPQGLGPAIGAH